ncbi:hypothetical protein [Micromonospora sp. NPDC049102]|uniref:hypothetical protein n=1 Tax=Micromonospora sp. NPDC049102 TaxID=3364265 RepID=UPI003717227F
MAQRAYAAAGAPNASPVSVAPSRAPRAHRPSTNPNAAIIAMKAPLVMSSRTAMKSRCPAASCSGSIGVGVAPR